MEATLPRDCLLFLHFIMSMKFSNIKAHGYSKKSNPGIRREINAEEREWMIAEEETLRYWERMTPISSMKQCLFTVKS